MADVIIAGAGVGGCVLGAKLAAKGLQVVLLDSKSREELGHDWSDSIEKRAFKIAGIPLPTEAEMTVGVHRLVVNSPSGRSVKLIEPYPYYIIDRRAMAKRLLDWALEAGADFIDNARVTSLRTEDQEVVGVNLKQGDRYKKMEADLVVDATGFEGVLRRSLPVDAGIESHPVADSDHAIAYREVREYKPTALEFTRGEMNYYYGVHKGYCWINLESENAVDVGGGFPNIPGIPDIKEYILEKIKSYSFITQKKLRGGGGPVVTRKALYNFVANGFVVLGDAACQSVPLNGCNCGTIMIAAHIASKAICSALFSGKRDISGLWRYNVDYQRGKGAILAAMDAMRIAFQSFAQDEIAELMDRDIITARQLAQNFNIQPMSITLGDRINSLLRGITRLDLLKRLNKASCTAQSIYRHYQLYPLSYDMEAFQAWCRRADELFDSLTQG